MDIIILISHFFLSLLLFHFRVILRVILFLFILIFLFNNFKIWIGLIIFLVYLGGLLILLIYVANFSSKKIININKNIFFLVFLLSFFFYRNSFWLFSNNGFDILIKILIFNIFLLIIIYFLFILMSIRFFLPFGKSLRSI